MSGGQWGTLSIEVPDILATVRNDINNIAEFLVAVLDIALLALQLVKTFLVGFLNPILALVQAVINEINALLMNLRQLGVYLTGDWGLKSYPCDELKGGFQEYQRRMVGRLTDRTDPTRPDVSADISVFSIFFYLSVDGSGLQRLQSFIENLLAYFNQDYVSQGSSLPTPKLTSVGYGMNAVSIKHPMTIAEAFTGDATPVSLAEVKWTLPAPALKNPFSVMPPLPPGGFIVTVSTLPEGIRVVYDRAESNAIQKVSASGEQSQPREYAPVRVNGSGQPLVIHGGAEMLQLSEGIYYNVSIDTAKKVVKPGKTRIYGVKMTGDDSIIPLELLKQGNDFLLQRTFYCPVTTSIDGWVNGEYSIVLYAKDMPYDGTSSVNSDGTWDLAKTTRGGNLYVRVAACSKEVADTESFIWDFDSVASLADDTNQPLLISPATGTGISEVGPFSDPIKITFPNDNTSEYLTALKTALAVLVFSRPDLVPVDDIRSTIGEDIYQNLMDGSTVLSGVARERTGLEPFRHLAGLIYEDYAKAISARNISPNANRADLLQRIDRVARDIYDTTGPMPDVEKFVVEQTEYLRLATWGSILSSSGLTQYVPSGLSMATILESLDSTKAAGADNNYGSALNPYSSGLTEDVTMELFEAKGALRNRLPQMFETTLNTPEKGWQVVFKADPTQAQALTTTGPIMLQKIYEKFIQVDGSLSVPPEFQERLQLTVTAAGKVGSSDLSPVMVINRDKLESWDDAFPNADSGMYYLRSLLAANPDIYAQSSIVLGVASSAMRRSSSDGKWINIRFFNMMPSIEDFLQTIVDWMQAIARALEGIIQQILHYIEFLEARIVDLQQLIRRISALLQSILGLSFQIPKCSALFLVSNGTYGVLSDLMTSQNKPNDSPLAYGGGIAVLFPAGPAWFLEMLKAIFVASPDNPQPNQFLASSTLNFPGIGGEPVVPPVDPEPDVL